MPSKFIRTALLGSCLAASPLSAELIVNANRVYGYDHTPMLPWINFRKHDADRPLPPYVEATPTTTPAPSDALVLFDGSNLAAWAENEWTLVNGELVTGPSGLATRESFGDIQIHLEFKIPLEPPDKLFNRGNNGVAPMGFYEIQIFDSHPMHPDQIYPDGQCAAIYGETPPLLNACRRPGEWQSFDLVFIAPRFDGEKLVAPAKLTLLHNGVLVHHQATVHGRTTHQVAGTYEPHAAKLPFLLKGHGSPVSFRNIWLRPL